MKTKEFYDKYWDYTKKKGHLSSKMPMRGRFKAALGMLEAKGKNKIDILEVGCGDGGLGLYLRQHKKGLQANIIGVDISEKPLQLAKQYYSELYVKDVEEDNLTFLGGKKFDYIVLLEVLEHLFSPAAALKKLKKSLKKDGYFVVSFPNIAWCKYRVDLLLGKFPESYAFFSPEEHLHCFTLRSFSKMLENAGLETVELGGHFRGPPIISKLLPGLFGYQLVLKAKVKAEK